MYVYISSGFPPYCNNAVHTIVCMYEHMFIIIDVFIYMYMYACISSVSQSAQPSCVQNVLTMIYILAKIPALLIASNTYVCTYIQYIHI